MARDGTQSLPKSERGRLVFRQHHFWEQGVPPNYDLLYAAEILFLCLIFTFLTVQRDEDLLILLQVCVDTATFL